MRFLPALWLGIVLSVGPSTQLAAQAPDLPKSPSFKDYPVRTIFHGTPAKPDFTNPATLPEKPGYGPTDLLPDADPRYRGSVEIDAHSGPNFAGSFTIAQWSCGSECSSMVVVGTANGHLYRDVPFGTLEIEEGNSREYSGLSFRLGSTLLVVEGCLDVDERNAEGKRPDCSRSYYNWKPPKFVLLRRIPLAIPDWVKRQ